MMGTEFGFGFGFHGLGMLFFWGLILFLVVLLVQGAFRLVFGRRDSSALEILDERFARDEISREEYGKKRRALTRQ